MGVPREGEGSRKHLWKHQGRPESGSGVAPWHRGVGTNAELGESMPWHPIPFPRRPPLLLGSHLLGHTLLLPMDIPSIFHTC